MFSALDTVGAVKASLLSYFASTLPLGNRSDQKELGRQFHAQLRERQFRGPYVEAQPAYREGRTLQELCEETDSNGFAGAMEKAARLRRTDFAGPAAAALRLFTCGEEWRNDIGEAWRRPLYAHQERAFRLANAGRSFVVATGTGSGKTECYLYPLIRMIASERREDRTQPGVRAILLFPMNALVEDQMRRLRGLLLPLNFVLAKPVTFGRYTGDTPKDASDSGRPVPERNIFGAGELLTREQMFRRPPDILVTNFTMLEYALLRPKDHRLFEARGHFRMLVLDEVHTYSGTVGAEVAMLLRRLRAFLGPSNETVCVGTSATLGDRSQDIEAMARFASEIFGSEVSRDRIVLAHMPQAEAPRPAEAEPAAVAAVAGLKAGPLMAMIAGRISVNEHAVEHPDWPREMAEDAEVLALALGSSWPGMDQEIADEGAWKDDPTSRARRLLGKICGASPLAGRLSAILRGEGRRCIPIEALAEQLFSAPAGGGGADRLAATEVLLAAMANAEAGRQGAMPTRLHFFIGEQQEAYLCVNPACPARSSGADAWWSRLFLDHHTNCPDCGAFAFRLLLCRKCGFALLEAWRTGDGRVVPETGAGEGAQRLLLRPLAPEAPAQPTNEAQRRRLCLGAGHWFENGDRGRAAEREHQHKCAGAVIAVAEWSKPDGDLLLEDCPECEQGWYTGKEVLTAAGTSPYGVASVAVEEMARRLRSAGLPSKIIGFSDSRQQAAKLAARLQRSNRDYVFRQLLLRAICACDRPANSREILAELFGAVDGEERLRRLLAPRQSVYADDEAIRTALGELLFREAVSPFRSLESIGIATVGYPAELRGIGARLQLPRAIGQTSQDGEAVLRAILDLGFRFRRCVASARRAIRAEEKSLQRWKIYRRRVRGQEARADAQANSPLFLRAFNLRNPLLNLIGRAWARAAGPPDRRSMPGAVRFDMPLTLEDFNSIIASFWDSLFSVPELITRGEAIAERDRPLIASALDSPKAELALNLNCLSWSIADRVFVCDTCGQVSAFSVRAVCPTRDCAGTLREATAEELDDGSSPTAHYRRLVQQEPAPLRVAEHTAEISPHRRAEIEAEFRSGGSEGVDMISGSTTFELGVDIGEVNSVYLANLPPRLANYRQRAGRAGRAKGASPLIVNFVRHRPHDQYFWNDLGAFINGPVPPPRFKLSSETVLRRHGHSILLAAVLKAYDERGAKPGGLWGPAWENFAEFILGPDNQDRRDRAVEDAMAPLQSVFAGVDAALSTKLKPIPLAAAFFEELERSGPLFDARRGDGVIELFGDFGLLPSYSFPLYVDELRLYKCKREEAPRKDLRLTRDRRISLTEYHPGRVITAGGHQIRSLGL